MTPFSSSTDMRASIAFASAPSGPRSVQAADLLGDFAIACTMLATRAFRAYQAQV